MKFVDAIIDRVLDRLVPVLEKQGQELKDEALALIANELPHLAATIAEQAVKTIFEHTQIDESVNEVSNVFNAIIDRLPKWPLG